MLQSGHDGKLLWHPDPVPCAAASFQAASAVQLSQSKGSVYQTSDGYTRDPMIPSPPFGFRALGVLYGWRSEWVERASAHRQPRCQPRPRLSTRMLSAASVLRHEVREEPAGAGGEVGLVVCKPGGRAAGETGDEAACAAAPALAGVSRQDRCRPAWPAPGSICRLPAGRRGRRRTSLQGAVRRATSRHTSPHMLSSCRTRHVGRLAPAVGDGAAAGAAFSTAAQSPGCPCGEPQVQVHSQRHIASVLSHPAQTAATVVGAL
jgi:hypothetical protein